MNDMLSVTRSFSLEVLVCLVMLLSMAVGVVCIGGYHLVVTTLSRMSFVRVWAKTSGPALDHSASTPMYRATETGCEVQRTNMTCLRYPWLMIGIGS